MGVDGERIDTAAGNSGDAVLRRFGTQFQIGDGYRLRADRSESFVSETPLLLVLLDDLLGTGTQIARFVETYRLNPAPNNIIVVYVPLLATAEGLRNVERDCSSIIVRAVEVLDDTTNFFNSSAGAADLWSRDGANTPGDVRSFYDRLMSDREVRPEDRFSMALTALMPERCPNNTLRAYWARTPQWHPLKAR